MIDMNAHTKIELALYDFEGKYGVRPNQITMGYKFAEELLNQFCYNTIPIKHLEIIEKQLGWISVAEYKGIPVEIDYDNPDILKVGYYIEKW